LLGSRIAEEEIVFVYNYELTDLDISLRLGPLATSLKRMDVVPSPTAPEMLLDDCHALPSSKEAQLGVNLESSGADNKGHPIRNELATMQLYHLGRPILARWGENLKSLRILYEVRKGPQESTHDTRNGPYP